MTGQHRDDGILREEPPHPEEIAASRQTGKWLVGLGLLLLVALAIAGWAWVEAGDAKTEAGDAKTIAKQNSIAADTNAERAKERDQLLQAQIDQFEKCRGKPSGTPGCTDAVAPEPEDLPEPVDPVPVPDVIPGPPGPPPTALEVAQAVATYCAANNGCREPVTPAQVAAAVATYCDSRGECRGRDSIVPGPAGPGPTEAQVLDGVTAFCSEESQPCKGDDGSNATDEQVAEQVAAYCGAPEQPCKGEDSTVPGPAGRGLVDADCVNDTTEAGSHWLLTWSREPLETTVPGPCRLKPPEPSASPDPTQPPNE